MSYRRTPIVAAILVVAALVPSFAQEAPSVEKYRTTSITISPFHLLLPVFEITGEFRVAPRAGMAGIVGIGSIESFTAFELGGSFRYYIIGDFEHGMQIGGELLYVNVSGSIDDVSGVGNGLGIGPFIGYKVAAGFGLTLDAQAGVQIVMARAEAEDSMGNTGSGEASGVGVLLNINVGWTF